MSDDKNNDLDTGMDAEQRRRDLLKKLSAGGSTLAFTKWSIPVVATVVIPAHAQTSGFGAAFVATATF